MSIPKVIHQTWRTTELPPSLAYYHSTVKQHHPDYEIILWDDVACHQFVQQFYPQIYPTYIGYKYNIQRVDAFRYMLLHTYGGIYLDLDMEVLKSFDPLLDTALLLCVESPIDARRANRSHIISNAMMATVPNNEFFARVIQKLPTVVSKYPHTPRMDVITTTGPLFLTDVYDDVRPTATLLSHEAFFPLSITENDITKIHNNHTFAIHKFASTWWDSVK